MTDETLFEAVRRAIDAQGGSNAAAAAAGLAPRTVQRAKAGDAAPEVARQIIAQTRSPLWAIERLAKQLADDNRRASIRRIQTFIHIARQGQTTIRDVCEAIGGDPNSSSVHEHITRLVDLRLVERVTRRQSLRGGGSDAVIIKLSDDGWRALGVMPDGETEPGND